MTRVIRIFSVSAILVFVSCFSLDSFLFEETTCTEYLNSDTLKEYGARMIIDSAHIMPVEMISDGNKIYGFYVFSDSTYGQNGITILYFHGTGIHIDRYWSWVEDLWELGFNVLIIDYQGYGKSEGEPSAEGCLNDALVAYDYLVTTPNIIPSKVVFFGYSLGTFMATYLAAEYRHPVALILESAPASTGAIFKDSGLLGIGGRFVARADFDNEKRIDKIGAPLLMIHSKADSYVVFERHVPRVFPKAKEPKDSLWVEGAKHDNISEVAGTVYFDKVKEFIVKYTR